MPFQVISGGNARTAIVRSLAPLLLLSLAVFATPGHGETASVRDAQRPVDDADTAQIHKYIMQPVFTSPLIDYLPGSRSVSTSEAVLGGDDRQASIHRVMNMPSVYASYSVRDFLVRISGRTRNPAALNGMYFEPTHWEAASEMSFVGAAQEQPEMSVEEAIRRIRELTEAQVLEGYRTEQRRSQRDAHAKQHGGVRARFTISASSPTAIREGVFAGTRTYHAWIRFSNAVGTDDKSGLARGMAIKLLGVPGRKILSDEADATTQDFLLVNYPVVNVRTA